VAAQSAWHDYQPGSISAIMAQERDDILHNLARADHHVTVMSAESFPTRAIVQYGDSIRPTWEARLEVIEHWAASLRLPIPVRERYKFEVLFREDTFDLWLPMQRSLLPPLGKELVRGDRVVLFVAYVGAEGEGHTTDIDWVFIVNAWRKGPLEKGLTR
jgi:hypothetical protein